MRQSMVLACCLLLFACDGAPDGAKAAGGDAVDVAGTLVEDTADADAAADADNDKDSKDSPDSQDIDDADDADAVDDADAADDTVDVQTDAAAGDGAQDAADVGDAGLVVDAPCPATAPSLCLKWQETPQQQCVAVPDVGAPCGEAVPMVCRETQAVCDAKGQCIAPPSAVGTPCWATKWSTTSQKTLAALGTCNADAVCILPADATPLALANFSCKVEACDAAGDCTQVQAATGTPCDRPWSYDCFATLGICSDLGVCVPYHKPAGTSCMPGKYHMQCGSIAFCAVNGECEPTKKAPDGDFCATATPCGKAACKNGHCVVDKVLPTGASCAVGCIPKGYCDAEGFCQHNSYESTACNDGNICTNDFCCGGVGAFNPFADSTMCSPSAFGTCGYSAVSPGTIKCAPPTPCQNYYCAFGGCQSYKSYDPLDCGKNNKCAGDISCNFGMCFVTEKTCYDGNDCTADSCDYATGGCVNTPLEDYTVCKIGSKTGACQAGQCVAP